MHRPIHERTLAALGLCLMAGVATGCERRTPGAEAGRALGTADPAAVAVAAPASGCEAGPVVRQPLVLPDGIQAYVEPESLVRLGDDFVVAGSPTYTWSVGAGSARMESSDAHVAAYLNEPARLVEVPIDAPVGMVRAVALDDRRWGMLFTEAEPSTDGTAGPGTLVTLRYAEYDGDAWSAPETVPLPESGALFPDTSSPLVLAGSSLHWLVVTRSDRRALHYERAAGVWTVDVVEESGAEAAGLAGGPSGLWAGLTGFGPDGPGVRKSARLLHREGSTWRLVTRDTTAEPYTEVVGPSVLVGPAGATLTWTEARGAGVAMARVGVRPDARGTPVIVDPAAAATRAFSSASGEPRWAVWHKGPVRGTDRLRLVRVQSGVAETEQALAYPYTGYFAAKAAGPDQVVVTGSEFSPDPARPTVRSLTLRLNASCR